MNKKYTLRIVEMLKTRLKVLKVFLKSVENSVESVENLGFEGNLLC